MYEISAWSVICIISYLSIMFVCGPDFLWKKLFGLLVDGVW